MLFQTIAFKKGRVLFRNEIWQCPKTVSFISVFATIRWMKAGWPAEPILLTSTLLIGALQAMPASTTIK